MSAVPNNQIEEEAGYFIRGWQEIGDQVRQLVFQDARYQAIKTNWPSR